MPIYEETYESWHGRKMARPNTWWVIGKTGIRLLWTKGMMSFLLLAYIPFFVKAVQIYLITKLGKNAAIIAQAVPTFKVNPQFFLDFLQGQMLYLILILIFAGTGLIAKDRKFKAFSIYFSKPVSLFDYIGGKFMIIGFYGSLITIVPGLLLFLTRILFAQDSVFFNTFYWIPLSMIAMVLIMLLCMGGLALAFSAAAASFRSAGILFFGILTFPELIRTIFPSIKALVMLSIQANFKQINSILFNVSKPYSAEIWISVLMLVFTVLFSLFLLHKKVKPVEVIK